MPMTTKTSALEETAKAFTVDWAVHFTEAFAVGTLSNFASSAQGAKKLDVFDTIHKGGSLKTFGPFV